MMFILIEGEATKIRLQEYLSDCFLCHIRGKAKRATKLGRVLLIWCENVVYLKRLIVVFFFFFEVSLQISVEQLLLFTINSAKRNSKQSKQVVNSGAQN